MPLEDELDDEVKSSCFKQQTQLQNQAVRGLYKLFYADQSLHNQLHTMRTIKNITYCRIVIRINFFSCGIFGGIINL